jgi:nucleolysin TIA-1/TIAR
MSVDIKRDRNTGRNLGYGFVQMSSHEQAEEAKDRLQDFEISGRKIRVGWAQRNTTLFVGA